MATNNDPNSYANRSATERAQDRAYFEGYDAGLGWQGPERDGELGSLSGAHIERDIAPSLRNAFWHGFHDGQSDPRSFKRTMSDA